MAVIMGCGPDQVSSENLYFTAGKGIFVKGGAVGLTFSTTKITYTGTVAFDYGTAGIKTDLIAGSTGTTGNFNISLVDNLADALTIKEGTNPYLRFVTTNSSEAVNCYKAFQADTLQGLTAGTGLFKIKLQDNLADALTIQEAANAYMTFVTTDASESVDVLKALRVDVIKGKTAALSVASALSSPVTGVQSIADNGTIALPTGGYNAIVATSSAANKTGVILTAGSTQGQTIRLINTSANSLTFAAAGTSNVADGTGAVLAALTAMTLTWETGAARWFRG